MSGYKKDMERSGISDDNYVVQRNNFLPWIEKYRPQTFSNIISNEQNLIILKNMLKNSVLTVNLK